MKQILRFRQFYGVSTRKKSTSNAEYCLQSVRKHDYENFICSLLLKNTARSCAFAVRSFNIEVARVSEQTSQSNIALMRLKFWEESIDKVFTKDPSNVPHHPVAIELYKVITKVPLTKRYFKSLISSREEFLNKNTFQNLDEMEKYCDKTVSNIYYLLLEGSGVKNIHADHAASHLGKAQGIVQYLRTIPISKKINLISLPQDILAKNKVSQEAVLRAKKSEGLTESIFEVASRAFQHLSKAKSLLDQVPSEGRSVLLPAVNASMYLTRLQTVNYDVFHKSLQYRSWKWLPTLYISHFRNRY